MEADYSMDRSTEHGLLEFLSAFIVVNRLPETLGYNVIYVVIGVGLAGTIETGAVFLEYADLLLVTFFAVLFSKMQASVADAVHDYTVDKENPEKSHIASAVDSIGERLLFTILIIELLAGIGLWGWVTFETNTLFFLWVGVGSNLLGFVYSYPPRIKERGVLNHIVTTGVDVLGVVFPVALVTGAVITPTFVVSLSIVFLYAFGYHVVHQAADTASDRESGVSTFTQSIGISESVWLAGVLTGIAAVLTAWLSHFATAAGLFVAAGAYAVLAHSIEDESPRTKCDRIARWFEIGPWAVGINSLFAVHLFV
jgi:4-hydroxybenzoate polyprenyltransferase